MTKFIKINLIKLKQVFRITFHPDNKTLVAAQKNILRYCTLYLNKLRTRAF